MIKPLTALIPMVILTACVGDETISGYADTNAVYNLIEVNGAPPAAPSTIAFPEKGRVVGSGPCNRYFANQSQPYPWFELGPIGSTRRGCAALEAEAAFFAALARMTLAEVTQTVLILTNQNGEQLVFEAR